MKQNPKYNNTMNTGICERNPNPNKNEIREICEGIYLAENSSELISSKALNPRTHEFVLKTGICE
jgi:hypothetical protein